MRFRVIVLGLAAACAVAGWSFFNAPAQSGAAKPAEKEAQRQAPAPAQAGAAQVTESKDFEDWRLQCVKAGGEEMCNLMQHRVVRLEQGEATVLIGRVSLAKKDGKTVPHLRLITPVGVWLPAGLALKFDEGKQMNVPYLLCGNDGCMTDIGISDDFLPTAKKSGKLFVAYKLGNQQQRTYELSMKGFTAGLAALQTKS